MNEKEANNAAAIVDYEQLSSQSGIFQTELQVKTKLKVKLKHWLSTTTQKIVPYHFKNEVQLWLDVCRWYCCWCTAVTCHWLGYSHSR